MELIGINVYTEKWTRIPKVRIHQPDRSFYMYGAVQARQGKKIFLARAQWIRRWWEQSEADAINLEPARSAEKVGE